MQSSIIRPGLLVSLKTTLRGGVSYLQRTLEADHVEETGARVARWETTREIVDAKEHERAIVARGKARTAIVRECCASSFGLLCPVGNEDKLAAAIAEAQSIADEFNRTAQHTRIEVYTLAGRIADTDEAAARAIGAEVRELIEAMESGVRAADPDRIRDAATKARQVAGMLSPEVQSKVSAAIAEVRGIARDIVRRVEKAGETAAAVVEGVKLESLQAARFAVLDLDGGQVEGAAEVAPTPAAPRALDFAPPAEAATAETGAEEETGPSFADLAGPAVVMPALEFA